MGMDALQATMNHRLGPCRPLYLSQLYSSCSKAFHFPWHSLAYARFHRSVSYVFSTATTWKAQTGYKIFTDLCALFIGGVATYEKRFNHRNLATLGVGIITMLLLLLCMSRDRIPTLSSQTINALRITKQ